MTLVLDTSLLLAMLHPHEEEHERAVAFYQGIDEDLVTTPLVVAEMDYMLTQRTGSTGRDALWGDLESGAILVRWWATAMSETLSIARERPRLGLADASLLALAPVARTTRIGTLDRRLLRSARTPTGESYTLLP